MQVRLKPVVVLVQQLPPTNSLAQVRAKRRLQDILNAIGGKTLTVQSYPLFPDRYYLPSPIKDNNGKIVHKGDVYLAPDMIAELIPS